MRSRLTIITVILILFIFPIRIRCSPERIVIIVHPSNSLSEITSDELRKIYYGKKTTWKDGKKIEPLDLEKNQKARQSFSQIVFQMEPQAVERKYLKMAISGQGQPPVILSTPREVINFISNNAYSIGYLDEMDIGDESIERVKVIPIRE